jgi:hypothetical protein
MFYFCCLCQPSFSAPAPNKIIWLFPASAGHNTGAYMPLKYYPITNAPTAHARAPALSVPSLTSLPQGLEFFAFMLLRHGESPTSPAKKKKKKKA